MVSPELEERVRRHYEHCVQVLRTGDVEGFLDWLGPGAAEFRPFWEWRFGNVLAVRRCDIAVEGVEVDDDGLVVVTFHERTDLTVRGFDGEPVNRDADLHNRNRWRDDGTRFTVVDGAELETRRTLDGVVLTDEIDPWGFAAWDRFSARTTEP